MTVLFNRPCSVRPSFRLVRSICWIDMCKVVANRMTKWSPLSHSQSNQRFVLSGRATKHRNYLLFVSSDINWTDRLGTTHGHHFEMSQCSGNQATFSQEGCTFQFQLLCVLSLFFSNWSDVAAAWCQRMLLSVRPCCHRSCATRVKQNRSITIWITYHMLHITKV